MTYKILVALDFSKLGKDVANYGYELGKVFNADLTFMHIVPEPSVIFNSYAPTIPIVIDAHVAELKETAEKKLAFYITDACKKYNGKKGDGDDTPTCSSFVGVGDPAQSIIEYAKQGMFDLIVLGYRGHSAIEALLVGSVANKVTRYAPCSVLIYRPDKP